MAYQIITDSSANLPNKLIEEYNLKVLSFDYFADDVRYDTFRPGEDDSWMKEFYVQLRSKKKITTSCLNAESISSMLRESLDKGIDVIYFVFSSGLSQTYQIAEAVGDELKAQYPDRKIYVVDTLSPSFGQGLLVDYACRQQREGWTIEQVYEWHIENRLKMCHWFTVDDLFFLKRGGRISATTALAGTVLGIKPVLHVDNEGRLVNVDKVRGRRQALTALVNRMEKTAIEPKNQRVFIAHGDCLEDCKFVEKLVRERLGVKDIEITYINPVIGAHSGPGTVALFFLGTER